jgi:formamidopyrimidine-DNA glycosylase
MPELPEVETVRRMLEGAVIGRAIAETRTSGKKLREPITRGLAGRVRGRAIERARRHGKYLLLDLSGGVSLVSHLGMSGRWLFYPGEPDRSLTHVHVKFTFADGTKLWFQDPRRFGVLRVVDTAKLDRDPAIAELGPDPLAQPPSGESLKAEARGLKLAVKQFLLDQKRLAGVGNIYASEILFRAGVDPRKPARAVTIEAWSRIAEETLAVLNEAVNRMGTTFSAYRTLWNEPGT